MTEFVKICELDDVPPGKGKLIRLGDRQIHVFNREGRIVATLEEHRRIGGVHAGEAPRGEMAPVCRHPGSHFDAEQEDSPARVRACGGSVRVRVLEDGIYLAIEGSGRPIEASPLPY